MTAIVADPVSERIEFLVNHEPFTALSAEELEFVVSSLAERLVPPGEAVLVESGVPGTELYVVVHRLRARA